MIHYIENEQIRIGVKEFGAELTSFYNKQNHTEYLWQGDPEIWGGQSPVLFPIIGRLKDDRYTVGGKEYSMPKHGLARKRPFALTEKAEHAMTFTQTEDEDTLKSYPFRYVLSLRFTIEGSSLTVEHIIENPNAEKMYFSIGAHPAFNCKIGDTLVFEKPETLTTQMLDLHESLRLPDTEPVLNHEDTITITEHIFDKDALILSGYQSRAITLHADGGKRTVVFHFDSPYLGIWSKPGAPYVCLEPWYGVNDTTDSDGVFEQKEGIICLDAGKTYVAAWRADI